MSKKSLDDLIEQSEVALEKGESLDKFEVDHKGKAKEQVKSKEQKLEEKIKEGKVKKEKAFDQEKSIDTDNKEEKTEETDEKQPEEEQVKKAKLKKTKAKIRSKKYTDANALVDPINKYNLKEAIELAKKTSFTKFDGNIEVHVRLLSKTGKPEQVRGMLTYPHATGKKTKVVILDDKMIEEIAKTSKIDFDMALATPAQMPKVAKLAKILGPKGKMPNPKAGTVTENPEKTKADLEGGQVEYRTDSYGIIHQVIGKVSGKAEDLEENYKALLLILPADKIKSITMCATMGPGIKVSK